MLVAVDARGRVAWLSVTSLGLQDAYIDFLGRLLRETRGPVVAWLHGLDLRRAEQPGDWAAAGPPLASGDCPLPPPRRRSPAAPEIAELQPPPRPRPAATVAAEPPVREATRPDAGTRPFLISTASKADDSMNLTHLQRLEAESIHIMREVVAEADNPVMLY